MFSLSFINGIEEQFENHIGFHFSAGLKAETASTQVYKRSHLPISIAFYPKRRRNIHRIASGLTRKIT